MRVVDVRIPASSTEIGSTMQNTIQVTTYNLPTLVVRKMVLYGEVAISSASTLEQTMAGVWGTIVGN